MNSYRLAVPTLPASQALARLCATYWYPLYAYIRRRGHTPEEAQDLTQDFFARILEKGLLAEADPGRGRFRSFLRPVCAHYLANRRDHENARKRGGGRAAISIDSAVSLMRMPVSTRPSPVASTTGS